LANGFAQKVTLSVTHSLVSFFVVSKLRCPESPAIAIEHLIRLERIAIAKRNQVPRAAS
jgi:hypothetical protein